MLQAEFSSVTTQYGPLTAVAGMYEEAVDILKNTPNTTRTLKCRSGTTDNLQFSIRINTNN
jgi:hypothetical protein